MLSILNSILFVAFAYSTGWGVYATFFHLLARYPGPLLARVSRIWYLYRVSRGDCDCMLLDLHRKHGNIVRIAPDEVSISDPAAIGTIYNSKGTFRKTDFYRVFHQGFNDHLFTFEDESGHNARRKIMKQVYDKRSLLKGQHRIDAACDLFIAQMHRFAKHGEPFDLAEWFYRYASEVLGELFFGQRFGHLDEEYDMKSDLEQRDPLMLVITLTAVAPFYVRPMIVLLSLISSHIRAGFTTFRQSRCRAESVVRRRLGGSDLCDEKPSDLLDILVKPIRAGDGPNDFTLEDASAEVFATLNAGVDTIAIAMTHIVHEVIQHPAIFAELYQELAEEQKSVEVRHAHTEFSQLPFFHDCCREAMRLHPSVAMPLPRHVPSGGHVVSGSWFPQGVRIGISPHVVHRDQGVFGPDADAFNPHRWSENPKSSMDQAMFQFGSGKRACTGRQLAEREILSLIPRFLRQYTFEVDAVPLKSSTFFLSRPSAMVVRVRERVAKVKDLRDVVHGTDEGSTAVPTAAPTAAPT